MVYTTSLNGDISAPSAFGARAAFLPALQRVVTQQPLFDSAASLAGLAHLNALAPAPRSVFLGIGLTSAGQLSRALPLDVLGMLFAAEQVRRAARARDIVLLLADAHALENGHEAPLVARCASVYEAGLLRVIERLCWSHVHVLRATTLHASDRHARLHALIKRRAPRDEHAYVTREVADIEYFAQKSGGLLKVGWALRGSAPRELRDERAFDQRYLRWLGGPVAFVYCKPGRVLDDKRSRAAPYLVRDPRRRVCLAHDEDVHEKLRCAAAQISRSSVRGVRRHLRAIARSYKQLIGPLDGPVEDQIQQLIRDLSGRKETT